MHPHQHSYTTNLTSSRFIICILGSHCCVDNKRTARKSVLEVTPYKDSSPKQSELHCEIREAVPDPSNTLSSTPN